MPVACEYTMCSTGVGRIWAGGGGWGITGGCTPPYDFEQPLPLIYKAYCIVATCWSEANNYIIMYYTVCPLLTIQWQCTGGS